jgi:hypothetical protein
MEQQREVFESAKQAIAQELNGEILSWDFSKMLDEFGRLVASKSDKPNQKQRSTRHFCRHYLGMHGESFMKVCGWFSLKKMSSEDIQLVLRTLQAAKNGTLVSDGVEHKAPPEPASITPPVVPVLEMSGTKRTLIEHSVTVLSSLRIVIGVAKIGARDLFDGDRIQMRIALKAICDAFGIDVVFPEPEAAHNQPVTRHDLGDLGLGASKGRK